MAEGSNEDFGLPPVVETEEQRLERIRAKAAAVVAAETDEVLLKRMIAEERARAAPVSPAGQGFPNEYSKVIVDQGDNKQDDDFVSLGINGCNIKVPRGKEVIIQDCYVKECLERAVEEKTIKSFGGYVTRPAHRFHWRVIGKATEAEYKAFMETQKAQAQRELAQAA